MPAGMVKLEHRHLISLVSGVSLEALRLTRHGPPLLSAFAFPGREYRVDHSLLIGW